MTVVANFTHNGEEVSIPPPPYLAVVAKCQYLPRQSLAGDWTSVSTSPVKFGGGGGQMSLTSPASY